MLDIYDYLSSILFNYVFKHNDVNLLESNTIRDVHLYSINIFYHIVGNIKTLKVLMH